MSEIWVVPSGLSDYRVSSMGRVVKIQSDGKVRMLSAKPDDSGYIRVHLINNHGKDAKYRVHRLVAETFIPNPEGKPIVDHINGVRSDNRVENLRWATTSENAQGKAVAKKFKTRQVVQFGQDWTSSHVWESVISIKRTLGYSGDDVRKACTQGHLLHNCHWRYLDQIPIQGEKWQQVSIEGYELMVSSVGRVQTLSGTLTYGHKVNSGYLAVHIADKTIVVHKLIALAFHPIENPEQYQVNHIDYNKHNNRADNLEWVTGSENIRHAYKARPVKNQRPVFQINLDGTLQAIYMTLKEAAENVKVHPSCLINACEGKYETSMGYRWAYTSSYD